jgi:hypothetical protein
MKVQPVTDQTFFQTLIFPMILSRNYDLDLDFANLIGLLYVYLKQKLFNKILRRLFNANY